MTMLMGMGAVAGAGRSSGGVAGYGINGMSGMDGMGGRMR